MMAEAIGSPINSEYGPQVILGDARVEAFKPFGKGIQLGINHELEKLSIGGSAASEGFFGRKARESRDMLLANSISVFDSMKESFYLGDMQPKELSGEAYTVLHVVLGMQGPNIDIKGWSRSKNTKQTVDRMKKLMLIPWSFFYDGSARTYSQMSYHGRHDYIHMNDLGSKDGGMNLVIFPKDHDNGGWLRTNLRKQQHVPLYLSEDGRYWTAPNRFKLEENFEVEPVDNFDSAGSFCHHTARAIRAVNCSSHKMGFSEELYANSRPWGKEIKFEDAVGTISNLMTAFFAKPFEAIRMIEAVRLNEELPGWDGKLAREVAEKMAEFKKTEAEAKTHNRDNHWEDFKDPYPNPLYESLQIEGVDTKGWGDFLGKFDEVLAEKGGSVKGSFMSKTDAWKFKNSTQLAVFFRLFSPVVPEKMLEIVPKPENREVVDGSYSAGSIRNREELVTRISGAVEALEAIAEEMKLDGDENFKDVLETAQTLRKHYKFLEE